VEFDHQVDHQEMFDTTGMFFWCDEQRIEDRILDSGRRHEFLHHVVVCIFADKKSPLIGLRSFVLPLRASNYFYEELKPIIFVGDTGFLRKEWKSICNFPKVYIAEVTFASGFGMNKKIFFFVFRRDRQTVGHC
jgi:hypothetical protein